MSNTLYVLTTGGTIGSVLQGDAFAVAEQVPFLAALESLRHEQQCELKVVSVFNKNSENLTPEDWLILAEAIDNIQKLNPKGILVTHGTDTMSYSLIATYLLSANWKVPVCFTGAFYSPEHEATDAFLNLEAAMHFLLSDKIVADVYLAFRSQSIVIDDQEQQCVNVYSAATVKSMEFDQSVFSSLNDHKYATISKLSNNSPSDWNVEFLNSGEDLSSVDKLKLATIDWIVAKKEISNYQNQIAIVKFAPGFDSSLLSLILEQKQAVIVELYHSGTANVLNKELLEGLKSWEEKGKIYFSAFPSGAIEIPYLSTTMLVDSGASIIKDRTSEYLYVYWILTRVLAQPFKLSQLGS